MSRTWNGERKAWQGKVERCKGIVWLGFDRQGDGTAALGTVERRLRKRGSMARKLERINRQAVYQALQTLRREGIIVEMMPMWSNYSRFGRTRNGKVGANVAILLKNVYWIDDRNMSMEVDDEH